MEVWKQNMAFICRRK